MTVPELRIAPDGRVATRTHRVGGPEWTVVAGPDASWLTQVRPSTAEVETWTLLVPATPLPPDSELRNEVARRFVELDSRDWGDDHGFAATYGTDAETDAFVDAVMDVPWIKYATGQRLVVRMHEQNNAAIAKTNQEFAEENERLRTELARVSEATQPGDAAERKLNAVIPLLYDLVDDEECSLDHHGYCQAHNWFADSECPNARAKRWLETLDLGATPTTGPAPAPIGYLIAGPSDEDARAGRASDPADLDPGGWDGVVHTTVEDGQRSLASCHAHGYVKGWKLYALTEVVPPAAPQVPAQPTGKWREGDIACDRTGFVQYGDDAMEAALGPLVRLDAIPPGTSDTGALPEGFVHRPAARVDAAHPDVHEVDIREDTDSARGPGWYIADCTACHWTSTGTEAVVEVAAAEHEDQDDANRADNLIPARPAAPAEDGDTNA